jgi:ribonuclease HI
VKKVTIYTDGACSGNPGIGGWAAILRYGEHEKEIAGFEANTTNNRMELRAVIEGLSALKESCEVELYSDSAYVINAFKQGWLENWKSNGWRNKNKEEVKNIELWKELDRLNELHSIKWIKVKGHSDNEMNNRCDKLATEQYKKRGLETNE